MVLPEEFLTLPPSMYPIVLPELFLTLPFSIYPMVDPDEFFILWAFAELQNKNMKEQNINENLIFYKIKY